MTVEQTSISCVYIRCEKEKVMLKVGGMVFKETKNGLMKKTYDALYITETLYLFGYRSFIINLFQDRKKKSMGPIVIISTVKNILDLL